jgi:hypothetical protein
VAGGAKLRQQIFQSKTGSAVLQAVDDFFDTRMNASGDAQLHELEPDAAEIFPREALACGD